MKNFFFLLVLTLIIPLLNYCVIGFSISNSIVLVYYLLLFGFIIISEKQKPILVFNFNIFFYCCLLGVVVYKLLLIYLFDYSFSVSQISIYYLFIFLIAPFIEEFFFRFYIFNKLKELSDVKIVFISSFLFALAHFAHSNGLIYLFILSLLFSYYYLKSKNLFMVYLIHLSFNIIGHFYPV